MKCYVFHREKETIFSFLERIINFHVQLFSSTCKKEFPIDLTERVRGTAFCDNKLLLLPKIRQFVYEQWLGQ